MFKMILASIVALAFSSVSFAQDPAAGTPPPAGEPAASAPAPEKANNKMDKMEKKGKKKKHKKEHAE